MLEHNARLDSLLKSSKESGGDTKACWEMEHSCVNANLNPDVEIRRGPLTGINVLYYANTFEILQLNFCKRYKLIRQDTTVYSMPHLDTKSQCPGSMIS